MALIELQKFQFVKTTLLNEVQRMVEQMHGMHYPTLSAMVQCKSQQIEAEKKIHSLIKSSEIKSKTHL